MKQLVKHALLAGTALAVVAPSVAGQEQGSEDDPVQADNFEIEEIVVTGRVGAAQVSKFESAVAISTFNSQALKEAAPLSAAQLYTEIPGFFSEPSAGVVGNNVFPRGLPQPGSFRFLKLQEDGLPIMEVQELAFVNADTLVRVDDSLRRVEAVRGGTSSIFASNAAGGIINHITRQGTQDFEGSASFEYGNFQHYRFDGYVAGPISDNTTFMVGGFWRSDDGVRDPGFRANSGGQIRANVRYDFDRGSVTLRGKIVDEQNIFYLPIPLSRDGNDISGIEGFDPNFDTLTSADARFVSLLRPDGGVAERDLQNGVNTEYVQVGGKFEYELGDGWLISNNFRYTDGDVRFNAIFSLSNPTGAESFLDSELAALQSAFPDAGITDVQLRTTTGGETITDPGGLNGNGLVINSGWWTTDSAYQNIINDLQLNKQFDLAGAHSVTLGVYFSDVDVALNWNFNSVLQEVTGAPRLLDVVGVDAAGQDVAATTLNGFTSYGDFYRNSVNNLRVFAFYAFDEWQVTDALRIDVGLRYQEDELEGQVEQLQDFSLENNQLSPCPNSAVGTPGCVPTLADDSGSFGSGNFTPYRDRNGEVSVAVGANYTWTPWLATYARFNRTARTPDFDDFNGNPDEGFPVQDVTQVEAGVKLDTPYFRAFTTFFYSDLTDIPFNDTVQDPDTGELVTLDLRADSVNYGVEIEGVVGPFWGADMSFNATIQDPEFRDFAENSGNQVNRIPEVILNVRPGYRYDVEGVTGRVFMDLQHVGDRFVDIANNTVLPNYQTVGAGLTGSYRNFTFEFHAANLTNSIGLTEGNPRVDQVTGNVGEGLFAARPILGRNFRFSIGYEF